MTNNTLITHTLATHHPTPHIIDLERSATSLRPAFKSLLARANEAHALADALGVEDPRYAPALAAWTAACLRLVTSISNRDEALALDGLDGRSADDWIRYLLSLGITQD